jgi:SAM-dependent methyltransferase
VSEQWAETDLERVECCPACGAKARESLYGGLADPLFGTPGEWALHRCGACRSAYLDPRPTAAAIGRAYSSYFTHEQPEAEEPRGRVGRLRRRWLHGLLNSRYGYGLESASGWGGRLLRLVPRSAALTDRWVRHVRRGPGANRILDAGCGNGVYLLRMRAMGFDVRGIDVDAVAVDQAVRAGLDVSRATLADLDPAEEKFDAITLGHVIEHLPDPTAAMRQAHELLAPGGMLWIATPNVDAAAHGAFGRNWYAIDPPRHLVLFSREALRSVLANAGFARVEPLTPPPGAAGAFAPSAAIAQGLNPLEQTPPLGLRMRARAFAADLFHRARAGSAEELIFAAWKGSP